MSPHNKCVYARNHSVGEAPKTTTVDTFYNEAQIALIDKEIAGMAGLTQSLSTLLNLKARRNALVPVSKLPNDILLDIFLIVRDFEMLFGSTQWLRVTQICGHWRSVTVGTPSFWSRIHHAFLHEFTLVMLERSQQVPLEVAFLGAPLLFKTSLKHQNKNADEDQNAMIIAVLGQIKRIRVLCLDDSAMSKNAQKILATLPADRDGLLLENLEFCCPCDRFVLESFCSPSRLRRLYLSKLDLSWGMLSLPNVTQFAFHGRHSTANGSGAQFIAALQQMSRLEVLSVVLDDVGLRECAFAVSPANLDIHFAHLRVLEIFSDCQQSLEFFLAHTILPQLQELYIQREYSSSLKPINHSSVIRAIASAIRTGNFATPEVLTIGPNHLTISNGPRQQLGHRPMININFPLTNRPSQNDFEAITDILNLLCMTTPIGSIDCTSPLRQISLRYLDLSEDEFAGLFGHLPHLEVIKVSGELGPILFEALTFVVIDTSAAADSESHNGAQDHIQQDEASHRVSIPRHALGPMEQYLFASLKSIIWEGGCDYVLKQMKQKVHQIHDIHECLLFRRNWGAAITNLELVALDHLSGNLCHVDKLKEVVDNVVISGRSLDFS